MEEFLIQLSTTHPVIAPVIFIALRALAIIIPPIPGAFVDIPGIIIWGWLWGFIYAEAGIMLGAMVAFSVARFFKEPLTKKFVPIQKLHEWENKLSENQKFWTLVAIRLPTNPFFDYISYAAGLTKMNTVSFFFATLLGNAPGTFLFYYFGDAFFSKGLHIGAAFIVALFILWFTFGKRNSLVHLSKIFKG